MLIGQASINLTANVLSAVLGLLSVFVFTRLFSPHDYGVYLLGVGFASVISVFLAGWFRNLVLSGHARNDGTEVRGVIASGFALVCLSTPLAFALARLIGLDTAAALAAVALSIAIGLFDLTQDLIRARLKAFTVMRGTLVRSTGVLCLGVDRSARKSDRAAAAAGGDRGLPARNPDPVARGLARHQVRLRSHANSPHWRGKDCR